jgi:hypothetical protein
MATLLKPDGTEQEVSPEDKYFELKEIRAFLGGGFEEILLPGKRVMLVNDCGKLRDLPLSHRASEIAGMLIVGNALVCKVSRGGEYL